MKNKRFLVLMFGIFIFFYSLGIVLALYRGFVVVPNRFKAMTYNVVLDEEFYDDWGTKKVTITNRDSTNVPVALRVSFNEVWSNTVGDEYYTLSNKVNGLDTVKKEWTSTFLNDFILSDDGWYYYKKALNPEESVQLLNSISLSDDVIVDSPYYEDYKKYDYELSFNYEAIQATEKAISDVWNIDVSKNGNNINWNF